VWQVLAPLSCAAVVVALGPCAGDDAVADPAVLCPALERLEAVRATDASFAARLDAETAVVAALPSTYRDEAAVHYWPDFGDLPPTTDSWDVEHAVERLIRFYRDACGDDMFPTPPDDPAGLPVPECGIDGLDDGQGVCVERRSERPRS
jgi:hypothetical protein